MHQGASLQVDGKAFPEDYCGAALETLENAGMSEKFLGEGLGISGESVNFAVANGMYAA